jgi:hypothetical protein
VAGALDVKDYIAAIEAAGFVEVSVTPVYLSPEMVEEAVAQLDDAIDRAAVSQEAIYKTVFSAKVTARKP